MTCLKMKTKMSKMTRVSRVSRRLKAKKIKNKETVFKGRKMLGFMDRDSMIKMSKKSTRTNSIRKSSNSSKNKLEDSKRVAKARTNKSHMPQMQTNSLIHKVVNKTT
jgi:hypothetical protein